MSETCVIHVVDDDAAMRDSLTFVLEAADYRVTTYDSAQALLAQVGGGALAQGVIVTDVRMPGMTGLELIARLKDLAVTLPVIVLTGHADVSMAVDAMKAGVVDFIEKPFDDEALLRAVAAARRRIEGAAGRDAERLEVKARIAGLTARENDVFEAIAAGDSNKLAAQRLGISPRTVEIYRANVMEKMRARTLSDLVRMALLRDNI
jgi:two-component system, LuxR family, response regulator FixJ